MAERVEITDEASAYAWLKSKDSQTQVWFASRCALRVLPLISAHKIATSNGLSFSNCRGAFISACMASGSADLQKILEYRAASAARSSRAKLTADDTVSSQSVLAGHSMQAAHHALLACGGGIGDRSPAEHSATAAYFAATHLSMAWIAATSDANNPNRWEKLWHGPPPDLVVKFWDALKEQWYSDGPHWSFWIKWYEAILAGDLDDWDLIFQIARKLTAQDWSEGAVHVAEEIAAIEEKLKGQQRDDSRQPAFEPKSLEHLYTQKQVVSVNAQSMAVDIASAFERFTATGLNEPLDEFEPLRLMPRSLIRISSLVSELGSDETERELKEEIGRLNEKVARLEAELEKLKNASPPVFAPELKAQIAKSLGDWKLYGALVAGLWVFTGDNVGMQERLQNLLALRESVFGQDCPTPDPEKMLPPDETTEV